MFKCFDARSNVSGVNITGYLKLWYVIHFGIILKKFHNNL